ncbi:MAG: peptide MFS transporter [Chlamydiia bacterium]|nr:peptide MFS transporter [Chlamydiia bacterium]
MTHSHSLSKHPKELWILALTELCERFAFWGVGNLLVLYAIEYYHFPNDKATQIYGIFSGLAAFLPLIGGWVADRWNYQSPMLLGAIFNAIGCFILATGVHSFFYWSLGLIAFGYGIFTPSILTVLGFSYRHQPHLRESGFSIYYASINVGVFLALASLGTIAKLISWNLAFAVAGIVQTAGLIPLIWYLIRHKETYRSLRAFQKEVHAQKKSLTSVEKKRIWVIAMFCLVSILFWIAYNQAFSSMEIFAHDFMNKQVAGIEIPEGVFLSTESFFLILLAPLLSYLYARLQKKNQDPTPAKKTSYSLFAIAGSFLVMMIASFSIPAGAHSANVSSGSLVFAFFLMAIGEMLLAPIGLSMISRLSPSRYTALSVGIWYVCVGLAFFNGGMLASLMEKMGTLFNFFSIFVILTLVPAVFMWIFAKKLTKMSHFHLKLKDSLPHVER